ncbi:hypothetical protein [Agromyces binzhouensis]|uniref:hypothetical protein n=1 Tax=Agromyces binzhouensis TaxID=1817495 RepID=UPI00362B7634
MNAEWDESFFEAQQQDARAYWVCFWTGDDVEQAARHDPQRITGARSVEEVLAWLIREKGERHFELFVETLDHAETRSRDGSHTEIWFVSLETSARPAHPSPSR